ncbi:MAG: hypothetical protein WBL87_08955 [Methanothrix sp.]
MSRRKGGIWGGEDEKGQDKTNGPGAAKDGPAQYIIHESLPRGQAEVLLQECRQIIVDRRIDEEHIDVGGNAQIDGSVPQKPGRAFGSNESGTK